MRRIMDFGAFRAGLKGIYSGNDDASRGRRVYLGTAVMQAVYNAFITGVFYTGFLSMCGISITEVGVVTFIPFIANCFSVFSFGILSRFRRKKPVLLIARGVFYFLYIVAATVVPLLTQDHRTRLICFIGIVFVAHALYALFSSGFTVWLYGFFPRDNQRRMRFITS